MTRAPRKHPAAAKGSRSSDVPALDAARIVEAAWTVVDREGLGGLSTHKVAAELSVKQPALYYHVKSKQQLLSLMVEQMMPLGALSHPDDLPWWEWLREYGREQRRRLSSHRDGGLVAANAPPTEQMQTDMFPRALEPMVRAGMQLSEAAAAVGAIAGFVLGHVIYEQSASTRAFMEAFSPPDHSFEHGLDFIIAGVREKAGAAG